MMYWTNQQDLKDAVQVSAPDRAELLGNVDRCFAQNQGFTIATLNLDHVVKFRKDLGFLKSYATHSHITADGNPIVWLSRLAGQQIELIPGSELIAPVAELAAKNGVKVALVGSTEESLDAAARALEERYPGFETALLAAPKMGFDPEGVDADDIIARIRESGAGLCFVALGAPKQEIFAARASATLGHVGFLSIGAGLDFISGNQTRAPRIVQKLALEWLWRMMLSPKRLARRYAACFGILPSLLINAIRVRRAAKT